MTMFLFFYLEFNNSFAIYYLVIIYNNTNCTKLNIYIFLFTYFYVNESFITYK